MSNGGLKYRVKNACTCLPSYQKHQAPKKFNLAEAKTPSGQFTRVDFGPNCSLVFVVLMWSSARMFLSWELLLLLARSSLASHLPQCIL